jgi:hypothetical protein
LISWLCLFSPVTPQHGGAIQIRLFNAISEMHRAESQSLPSRQDEEQSAEWIQSYTPRTSTALFTRLSLRGGREGRCMHCMHCLTCPSGVRPTAPYTTPTPYLSQCVAAHSASYSTCSKHSPAAGAVGPACARSSAWSGLGG